MKVRNPIIKAISSWFNRTFADPAALGLFFTLLGFFVLIEFFGEMLAPILVSVVCAYLLVGVRDVLSSHKVPKLLSTIMVFVAFIAIVLLILLGLLPLLIRELTMMINHIPVMFTDVKTWIDQLSKTHAHMVSPSMVNSVVNMLQSQIINSGSNLLAFSLNSISGLITVILYVFLVPLMIFFMLKDSAPLSKSLTKVLPRDRSLVLSVWAQMHKQVGQYIRGRCIEIIIVTIASAIVFYLFGLPYAGLLAVFVGFSVLVPYVGAVIVVIPVVVIAFGCSGVWGFILFQPCYALL